MKILNIVIKYLFFVFFISFQLSCQESNGDDSTFREDYLESIKNDNVEDISPIKNYKLPNINLNNWKVTLPIGKPTEVSPPEILNYAKNETLKPFFYNDSINGALVFYTYPDASTKKSSYSKTEIKEKIIPGSNNVNLNF